MFFAITAFVVSAIQIGVGVGIGLSVAKHRRQQRASAQSAAKSLPQATQSQGVGRRPLATVERPAHPLKDGSTLPSNAAETHGEGQVAAFDGPAEVADALHGALAPTAVAVVEDEPHSQRAVNSISPAATDGTPVAVPEGGERRTATRRAFPFRQYVAPYHGGSLPAKASFREVECHDISSTGFSFLSTQLPDFDSVVVALGVPPQQTYLQAHIVNRCSVADGTAPLYRIGCRFAGQVTAW